MKKILIALSVFTVLLSSCFLWNNSLSSIVMSYHPLWELSGSVSGEYTLVKNSDFMVWSIGDLDEERSDSSRYSEVFYYGTDDLYQPYWFDGDEGYGPAIAVDGTVQLTSGRVIFTATDWGGAIPDYCDKTFIYSPVHAIKGDFGYGLRAGYPGIEVYDIEAWVSAVNLQPGGEEAVFLNAVAPAASAAVGLGSYMTDIDSVRLIERYMDTLVVCCSDSTHDGTMTLIDISTPDAPLVIGSTTIIDDKSSMSYHYKLDNERLYVYGGNVLKCFDISDPGSPVELDIQLDDLSGYSLEQFSYRIENDHIYMLTNDGKSFFVTDVSNPADADTVVARLHSGIQIIPNEIERAFAVSGDFIYLPSADNIEVMKYSSGVLEFIDYIYVGVPLRGVHKFEGDDYIYAVGSGSINAVSIKL